MEKINNVIRLLEDDTFSAMTMTEAVNRNPKVWRKIKSMGLFEPDPITTTSVVIDVEEGEVNVMPQTSRGGPSSTQKPRSPKAVTLTVPNFKRKAYVTAGDLQNVVDVSERSLMSLQSAIAKKSRPLDDSMEITHEFLMSKALQGTVADAEGNTIVNLFTAFGKSQTTIDFNFGANGNVIGTADALDTAIDEALGDETHTATLVLCSPEFWTAMLKNKTIFDIYKNREVGPNPLINDLRGGFEFQNLVFVKYAGSVTINGNKVPFVPTNEAIALPLGTRNTFKMIYAPADLLEFANTEAQPKYLTQSLEKQDGEDKIVVRAETNPLPICTKPDVLIRVTKSNS